MSDPRIASRYEPAPGHEGMYVRRATAAGRPDDRKNGVVAADQAR